ncbi:Dynamin [Cynara cardunculus var. scolymus]|uniref:Dynamin n=1 Tax=Cynara cardunculus var. scolymus TaxID=59895 RepID=A0A118K568_CYNCS|nr:Dynamin [Cynara cardunculus var. scolymus]
MKMQRAMEWSVVDYINTSHPNFIGGNKAVEVASHQVRSNRLASPTSRQRDGVDSDAVAVSGSNRRSNAIVARAPSNGISVDPGVRSVADVNGNGSSGSERGSNWRIASFFRGREVHNPAVDISRSNTGEEIINHKEHVSSIIHLREPPLSLNSSEMHSEHEAEALAVTKQLLESYYSIVREKIQDSVPKAIMHFLVNHTKRELCNVLIKSLYRESLFEKLLQETDEVSLKRRHAEETLIALQEASHVRGAGTSFLGVTLLDELLIEVATVERGI